MEGGAGSSVESTKRIGRGAITSPEIERVVIQVTETGKMVHGSGEKELDFPWHLRASRTKAQRWVYFFSVAFVQCSQASSCNSLQVAMFESLYSIVVLQQLDFGVVLADANVVFKGLLRMAYLGGVTPFFRAHSTRSSGAWQQHLSNTETPICGRNRKFGRDGPQNGQLAKGPSGEWVSEG